jgi:TatD DNase family protein
MLIDTHSHLNFNAYKDDLDEVIKRTLDSRMQIINVGSKYETSKRAVEIAEKYQSVYAAIGLHPIYASDAVKIKTDPEEGSFLAKTEVFEKEKYKELAKSEKVVAMGEIGLDYYYRPKTKNKLDIFKQKQKEIFVGQLDLAQELNLPVILHCRMAHGDLLQILNERTIKGKQQRGVIHCFTGSWEEAKQYLALGFYLGLNGIIFKLSLKEVIEKTPLDKILIETDCPYLVPPMAGVERNEPIFVKYVVEEITKIKKIGFEEVASATTQNARNLFKI